MSRNRKRSESLSVVCCCCCCVSNQRLAHTVLDTVLDPVLCLRGFLFPPLLFLAFSGFGFFFFLSLSRADLAEFDTSSGVRWPDVEAIRCRVA